MNTPDTQSGEQAPAVVSSAGSAVVAISHPKIFQPTLRLRWRKPDLDPIAALFDAINGKDSWVLQQAWSELATGEVEWRDVPKEDQPNKRSSDTSEASCL